MARNKTPARGVLGENGVVVWDEKQALDLHSSKYYGKLVGGEKKKRLLLSLEEALYLLEKGRLVVEDPEGRELGEKEFYEMACRADPEFPQKYLVYKDLRDRGYIVKSGLKFGTHYRVYERGVNPYKEGPKTEREHTKYNVHAVRENATLSYAELSRFVRLSRNIRATPLLGVVDSEGEVTYYRIERERP